MTTYPSPYPSPCHWELFALYQVSPPPLTPLAFLQRWNVSYPELAQLAGVSRSTVEHWFSLGTGRREPALRYCRRLAEINFLWSYAHQIPPHLLQLWSGER